MIVTTRRGFLQSCLALAAAPAIVRADSLMRIVPRGLPLVTPLYFFGFPGDDVIYLACQSYYRFCDEGAVIRIQAGNVADELVVHSVATW